MAGATVVAATGHGSCYLGRWSAAFARHRANSDGGGSGNQIRRPGGQIWPSTSRIWRSHVVVM
jgi:hypothetical protein